MAGGRVDDRLAEGGAQWFWAKSGHDDRGVLTQWLPLHQHLEDSTRIAGLLWDRWLAPHARALVAQRVGGEAQGRAVAMLLSGVHDIGKATPVFQRRESSLAQQLEAFGLSFDPTLVDEDYRLLQHGLAGQVLVARYLREQGFVRPAADQWAAIVGAHHGIPPEDGEVVAAQNRPALLGSGGWGEAQRRLLEVVIDASQADLAALAGRPLGQPAAAVLSGLVITADWLASNVTLFPLAPLGRQPVGGSDRAAAAWSRIRLPSPWRAVDSGATVETLLRDRFELPASAIPRPVQTPALQAARSCDLPGMIVIEAPMGEGKTEAALMAAEVLAARSGASGCFVALPTQATTNAMFGRVLQWLSHVPDDTVARESGELRHTVSLAHGKASLDPLFRSLKAPGRPRGVELDAAGVQRRRGERDTGAIEAYLHWWMSNRKKSPLAEFVVGTIDQLLFVSLQARHLALRHLGVVGKVVIIDEVHSYDAYMNEYLERTLEWLGAYGVPVVLLSATLPPRTRSALIAAHRTGARALADSRQSWTVPRWAAPSPDGPAVQARDEAVERPPYPAVTVVRDGAPLTEPTEPSGRGTRVRIDLRDDRPDDLLELLVEALAEGGCALVVRNTVRSARETYDRLVGAFGDDVRLTHSRFLAADRAQNDAQLLAEMGPDGRRPDRRVVVATQVVEQSLDVDFDLLVTDLAPIDLVLQRIGRLHRHQRPRPAPLAVARCVVLTSGWAAAPVGLDHGTRAVYDPYLLWRSAAELRRLADGGSWLNLPGDIAPLVHQVYGDHELCPASWRAELDAARVERQRKRERQRSKAQTFRLGPPHEGRISLTGWLGRSVGEADESADGLAQVRDTEDSIEVLALLDNGAGGARVPDWVGDHGGEPVPDTGDIPSELAAAIAACALRLPAAVTRGERGDRLLAELVRDWHPANFERSPDLRGQLVLRMTPQPGGGATAQVAGTRFDYRPRTGLHTDSAAPGGPA